MVWNPEQSRQEERLLKRMGLEMHPKTSVDYHVETSRSGILLACSMDEPYNYLNNAIASMSMNDAAGHVEAETDLFIGNTHHVRVAHGADTMLIAEQAARPILDTERGEEISRIVKLAWARPIMTNMHFRISTQQMRRSHNDDETLMHGVLETNHGKQLFFRGTSNGKPIERIAYSNVLPIILLDDPNKFETEDDQTFVYEIESPHSSAARKAMNSASPALRIATALDLVDRAGTVLLNRDLIGRAGEGIHYVCRVRDFSAPAADALTSGNCRMEITLADGSDLRTPSGFLLDSADIRFLVNHECVGGGQVSLASPESTESSTDYIHSCATSQNVPLHRIDIDN